jgi:hypothetical protein
MTVTRNLVEEARGLMAKLNDTGEPWPDGMVSVQFGEWVYVLQLFEGDVVGCVTTLATERKLMAQWLQTTDPIQAAQS